MHVGRVLLDRFREHGIDEANDRRVVVALEQVRRLLQLLGNLREVELFVEPVHHRGGIGAVLLVGLLQQRVEDLRRHAGHLQRHAGKAARFGHGNRRGAGPVHGQASGIVNLLDQDAVPFREREGQDMPGMCGQFDGWHVVRRFENDVGFGFHLLLVTGRAFTRRIVPAVFLDGR